MQVYGIDFTSHPHRRKPMMCLACVLNGNRLKAQELTDWRSFEEFEAALQRPGTWIAGIDFLPFRQTRRFIETIGWPATWPGYVAFAKMARTMPTRETDVFRRRTKTT